MKKVHGDAADLGALPAKDEFTRGVAEGSKIRPLDLVLGADLGKPREVSLGHREHHALLRLGDPHLGRIETRVLERRAVEVDLGTERLAHLAHRARKPARTAVGDRMEERPARLVPRREHRVEQGLLADRVTDLHGVPELVGVGRLEFGA